MAKPLVSAMAYHPRPLLSTSAATRYLPTVKHLGALKPSTRGLEHGDATQFAE